MKKLLHIALSACLLMSLMPVTAFADVLMEENDLNMAGIMVGSVEEVREMPLSEVDIQPAKEGSLIGPTLCSSGEIAGPCGDGVVWSYDSDTKRLTISYTGSDTGAMTDYDGDYPPWSQYSGDITSAVIGDGVTTIGKFAFERLNIATVTIPNSVKVIGDCAFQYCEHLDHVTIPGNVEGTTIGDRAFMACRSLSDLTLCDGIVSIRESAFESCYRSDNGNATGLVSVSIPASVTYIGENVFKGCWILESISMDDANQNYMSADGILFRKNSDGDPVTLICYPPAGEGSSYAIPGTVGRIAADAFNGCAALTSVTIPGSVTAIGSNAFSECAELGTITFTGSVPLLNDGIFMDDRLTAYYPCNDGTWTANVRLDYGGDVTWKEHHTYDYSNPKYYWSDDNTTCTGVILCQYDTNHETITETAGTTRTVITEPTCTSGGKAKYVTDEFINGNFTKQEKNTDLAALGHNYPGGAGTGMTLHAAKAPTCMMAGNNAYYECSICHGLFKDAAGTIETTVKDETIPATGHTTTLHAAVTPTCTTGGNNEYYTCGACSGSFKDEGCLTPTEPEKEALKALGHDWSGKNGICRHDSSHMCDHNGITSGACPICGKDLGGGMGDDDSDDSYYSNGTYDAGMSSAVTGTWLYDLQGGTWSFTVSGGTKVTGGWVKAVNPYATGSQPKASWFYFDENGRMLTGWRWIKDSDGVTRCYYLNPLSEGLLGACWLDGRTPDGYTVDKNGAWTENGKVRTR